MLFLFAILASLLIVGTNAQRGSFAGSRPGSGYKDAYLPQRDSGAPGNSIEDRFGATNNNLPYDALGDTFAVDYYNQLPVDQRPFWILNQQHIEKHRGTPPRQPTAVTPKIASNIQNIATRIDDRSSEQQPINQRLSFNQPQQFDQQSFGAQFNTNQNRASPNQFGFSTNSPSEQQRLDSQIQLIQQRLDALMQERHQIQSQSGQQPAFNYPYFPHF